MASGMTLTITVMPQDAEMVLQRFSAGFTAYLATLTREAAELTKFTERQNAPEGVAGVLGQGIRGNIDIEYDEGGLVATVGPNDSVPYAGYVETGTNPHFPPAFKGSALDQWCEMHGLNTYAVAKSIATKGTQAHPYIKPTYDAMLIAVPDLFSQGVSRFLERTMA